MAGLAALFRHLNQRKTGTRCAIYSQIAGSPAFRNVPFRFFAVGGGNRILATGNGQTIQFAGYGFNGNIAADQPVTPLCKHTDRGNAPRHRNGQIEGKQVRFLLSDAGSPTVIEDIDDPRTLYVLMPMRV